MNDDAAAQTWTIWIDHGYEGEKYRYVTGTEDDARRAAAEAADDPYVMRTAYWRD